MSYIAINNINKSFGSLKALTEINANVEKGELVSLLGPSGCGKSTLLRIISGLETSDSGNIIVNNKDISNVPVNKRNMGMVFQAYSLFPNMTAKDNISFGLKLKKLPAEEINKRVNDIIELVDLKGRENHYPNQLSGGQQQRVALARALVTNPDVLLLDEPLSALDAKIRVILRGQIREIQQKLKITTIFVTHDQEEALSISDKIFVMEKGIIVQQGTSKQIYQEPKCQFAASFIGTYNFLDSSFLNMDYFNGTLLLRPEHIDIYHKDQVEQNDIENLYIGKVNQIFFLGSVTRIVVKVNDRLITVDKLNKSGKLFDYGEEVYLKIDKDKVLKLS
jgi:putative spermidine/putrescine transport system ATP-binding protein